MRQNKKALTSFLESETVELKLDYTDSIRKDIIAFANTSGGIIYIGIADDGTIVGVTSADQDDSTRRKYGKRRHPAGCDNVHSL